MSHTFMKKELPLNAYHLGLYMGMVGDAVVLCPFEEKAPREAWTAGWQLGYRFFQFGEMESDSERDFKH